VSLLKLTMTPFTTTTNASERADLNPLADTPPPGMRALARADIEGWVTLWRGPEALQNGLRWQDAAGLIWNQPGLRATLLLRLAHALWRAHVPALPGMVARYNLSKHGLDVPPSVEIGPGLYVPHPVGTVVTARRIGARVSLISGITIGMRQTPEFPVLGDDVYVGAGARILGAVIVGDGASVGANAVVLADVPPGATAVGIPARVKLPKNSPKREEEAL